jgi:hypothetical protein
MHEYVQMYHISPMCGPHTILGCVAMENLT